MLNYQRVAQKYAKNVVPRLPGYLDETLYGELWDHYAL